MAAMPNEGVVFVLFLLFSQLSIASSYRCSNRLYRGQRLLPGEHLCSRNLQYRMLFNATNGQVNISESFPRVKYYKPPPPTLFITATSASVSQYLTVSDLGDFLAVSSDNSISWRTNVTDGSFLELQDTGVVVLFAVNTTTNSTVVKWKSPSQYSLRLAGGTTTAGRVEVFYGNTWGTVCNDAFDDFDATVACRTLGFQSGVSVSNTFGAGSGQIWLTKMLCRSTEDSLQQCAFNDDEKTWGDITPCTHSQDAAVSCTGSWTLGVLSPLQHVCVSRLYVGQTLSIGESLCGGVNGEYALRLTNKFGDTALVLEEKGKRRWMVGWKANTPAGVKATLGTDGVLRLIGSAAGLPYALFTQNITDAAFLDIQVDGTVKVVSRNGTVGWKKAANDYCYEEVKQTDYLSHDISNAAVSFMTCADSCTSDGTCKAFTYSDSAENAVTANCPRGSSCCVKKNAVRWDTVATLSYYEKLDGCSSGSSCYTLIGNTENQGFDVSSTGDTNVNACMTSCDGNPRCRNIVWFPTGSPKCYFKWLKINESRGSFAWDHFPARLPCTPTNSQNVSTTIPPSCPSQLQPNGYLLKGERLCSPSGQHVLSVEPDGRLLLDAGQWTTGSPSGTTAALHLTDTKLLLRLDDGSVKWSFDWSNQTSAGSLIYLELQDSGLLQLASSFGFVIWNHLNRSIVVASTWSLGGFGNATVLVDGDNSSCLSSPSMSFIGLRAVPLNAPFPVSLVGRKLKCDATSMRNIFTLVVDMTADSNGGYKGRFGDCQLSGGNSTLCRFQCQSAATSTPSIALNNLKCGQVENESEFCEILLQ